MNAREQVHRFVRGIVTMAGTTPSDDLYAAIRAVATEVINENKPAPATSHGEEWEPTEEQVNHLTLLYFGRPIIRREAEITRSLLIAGHRIAKENTCSQQYGQSSRTSSDRGSGIGPDMRAATKPVTPPPPALSPKASSLDDRCEAIFAKWPELRPRRNQRALTLTKHGWAFQAARDVQTVADDCGQALVLAAILPHAIKAWTDRNSPVFKSDFGKFFWQTERYPPRTLEDAVKMLEGV